MMVTFKSDISKRKKLFTQESFAHPAKMHLGMLLWITGRYTKPGETILDPMFGAGSTMLAARYGRNVIGVELEQKFVDLAKGNWDKVMSLPKTKFGLGSCQIVQGDARSLEGLLVDSVLFSPPYAGAKQVLDSAFYAKALKDLEDRDITQENAGLRGGEDSDGNISNLPYGKIDTVITSPPYEATFNEKQHTLSGIAKRDPSMGLKVGGYSGKVDAVISSPPYENQIHKGSGEWAESPQGRMLGGEQSSGGRMLGVPQGKDYTKTPENIGNLRKDTYLEAMLQVYQQCYKVLKPNGLMILVTKDFIRNQKRILLSIDTIALCEQAGFAYEDWHQRKLTQQSFWRINYARKYPKADKLDTEDILVFRKLSGKGVVDAVVTSPPYADGYSIREGGQVNKEYVEKRKETLRKQGREELANSLKIEEYSSRNPENIGNLPYNKKAFRSNLDNIGNLPYDGAKVNDEWIKSRQGK